MIKLTRLDGKEIFINHSNIQWIESLPDTTITILSGARIIVREKMEEILFIIDERVRHENSLLEEQEFMFPIIDRHNGNSETAENS